MGGAISKSAIVLGVCVSWEFVHALQRMFHPVHSRPPLTSSPAVLWFSDPTNAQWVDNDQEYRSTNGFVTARTRVNFKSLIEICKKTNVYTPAVTAAVQWLNNEPRLSATGLTSVIQIFGLASLIDDAIDALDIAKSKGLRLNAYHYNACMNACKIHKRYDEALELFARMKEERVRPDLKSFSIVIQVYGLVGEWETALGIFNAVPTQDRDSKLFTNILSAMEKSARSDEALKIWMNMKRNSENMCTSQALNAVISSLGKDNRWEEAVQLFEQEILYVDKMILFTLTGILEKADQSAMANKVKALYRHYNDYSDNLSKNISNTLNDLETSSRRVDYINGTREEGCINAGDTNVCEPSGKLKKIVFNDLIREAKRSGDYRAAVKAADTWLETQNKLSPGGVTACINIYGLANQPTKLCHVLDCVINSDMILNVKQVNTYMAALNRCGEYVKTCYMFLKMEDRHDILRKMIHSRLQKLINENSPTEDEEAKRFMVTVDEAMKLSLSKLIRDDFSYGAMLNALEKMGRWKLATQLFDCIPSAAGSRSAPRSKDDYRIAVTKNVAISKGPICRNTVMYNTVLSAVCKAGRWREALDIYDSLLLEANIDPDKTSKSLMTSVLMKSRQYTAAAAIKEDEYEPGEYTDMEEEVVVPSRTFSSLLTPQMIIELEKLNPDFDEENADGTSSMQWSDVAAKYNSKPTPENGGLNKDDDFDTKNAEVDGTSWKVVHDDDDIDGDDTDTDGLSGLKFSEWDKEDEMLVKEMGAMELRDEKWANQVTNPQGVIGRAASLEDKLLYQPNSSIDGILKALSIVGRFESAVELLERLEKEGVPLKVSHYNSAIKACGDIGNWEGAVALLDHMVGNDVPRSSTTYSLMMNILWEYCGDEDVKNSIKRRGENEGMISEFTDSRYF